MKRNRWLTIGIVGLVSILAACGNSGNSTAVKEREGGSSADTVAPTSDTTTTTTTLAPGEDMTLRFRTEDGDAGQLTAFIGEPQRLANTGLANKDISGNCSLGDRDLLVQVKTTFAITSSMTTKIAVSFNTFGDAYEYGIYVFDTGPVCQTFGNVSLGELNPNSLHTFTYWVVFPNVITPNNSSGTVEEGLGLSLFSVPGIVMGGKNASYTEVFGSQVFKCSAFPYYGADYKVVYAPIPSGSPVNEPNMEDCVPTIG